jgi:low temperature requirement protein LtrA
VLLALGVKKTLGEVDEPLKTVSAVALCGGTALFLLADVAFRVRSLGVVEVPRLVAAALCLVVVAIAGEVAAPVALACVAAVCVGLVIVDAVRVAPAP